MIDPRNLKGLRGFLIDAPEPGRLRGLRDGAILVEDGLIAAAGPFEEVRRAPGAADLRWQHSPEAVIIPGLIDLHAHLPQYPVVARADASAQSWLERQALPAEKQFHAAAARQQAPAFFEALARHGTTCALLHAAIQEESCDAAFQVAERSGLRLILGQTLPAAGPAPGRLLEQSERLCRQWHRRDGGRLEYAFTLRAAAGGEELTREAGLLARKFDACLQVELAGDRDEIAVLEARGALGDRTVLTHGLPPGDEDLRRLAASGCAVAHCPTSDLFLGRGLLPLDRLCEAGLRVGLGSDVAAGPELDLWRVMRAAIESQKARSFYQPGVRVPAPAEVFHLATLGGARALGKESAIGVLDIGHEADLVVLDLAPGLPYGGRGNLHSDLSAEEVITLLVYRGGPQAVIETFVRGASVHRAPAPLLL